MPPAVVDTRPLFRPLCAEIVATLRSLDPDDWLRPTVAGSWRVRDVAAHLLDTALRRLSLHRDRPADTTSQPRVGGTPTNLVAFVNDLNASWIRAAERLSPRVITDLYARAGTELADFMETLSLSDDAFWPVSWAGEGRSAQWLDIGREFTEVWHHGSQIRDAVGAGPFAEPRWLRAVLRIAVHVLPHAYRDMSEAAGVSLVIDITGHAGGTWTLQRTPEQKWDVEEGRSIAPTMIATMTDEVAWRLLFNALPERDARSRIQVEGKVQLAEPLLSARSVIV